MLFGYTDLKSPCKSDLRSINTIISVWEESIIPPVSWKKFYEQEFYGRIKLPQGLNLWAVFETYFSEKPRHFYSLLQQIVYVLDSDECHSLVNQKVLYPHDLINFIDEFFQAFLHLYKVFYKKSKEKIEIWLQSIGELTDVRIVEKTDKFTLFVSMNLEYSSKRVIASLITETHTDISESDSEFVGWCFKLKAEQIYGAEKRQSRKLEFYLGCLHACKGCLPQWDLLGRRYKKTSVDFIYPVADVESMLHSDTYNEVFLDGSTEPMAVFCRLTKRFNQDIEKSYSIARKVAREKNKPIVFLDERKDVPSIVVEQPLKEKVIGGVRHGTTK